MLKFYFSLFFTLLLFACSKSPQNFLKQSQDEFSKGNYSASLLAAKSALQENDELTAARLILARSELATGDYESALKNFEMAGVDKDSESAYLDEWLQVKTLLEQYNSVVDYYSSKKVRLSDRGKAFVAFSSISINNPNVTNQIVNSLENSKSSYAELARAYFSLSSGKVNDALAYINKSLDADNKNADAYLFKAIIEESSSNFITAISHLEQYKILRPADSRVLVFLARTSLSFKDLDRAELYASEIVSLSPRHPLGNYVLAAIAYEQERYSEVPQYIQYSINNEALRTSSQIIAGTSAFNTGNFEVAFDNFEPLVGLFAPQHPINDFIVATSIEVGDTQTLERTLQQIYGNDHQVTQESAMNAAIINLATKESSNSAAMAFLTSQKTIGSNNNSNLVMGLLSTLELENEAALGSFRKAIELEPENTTAYVFLVQNMISSNDVEGAISLVSELKSRELVLATNLSAYIELSQGNNHAALAELDSLLNLDEANELSISLGTRASIEIGDLQELDKFIQYSAAKGFSPEEAVVRAVERNMFSDSVLSSLDSLISFQRDNQTSIANALIQNQRNEDLLNFFSYLEDSKIENIDIANLYIRALVEEGQFKSLEQFLIKWIVDSNYSSTPVDTLSRFYKGQGNTKSVLDLLNRVKQQIGLSGNQQILLLESLVNLRQFEQAHSILNELLEANIDTPELYLQEAKLHYFQGNFEMAKDKFAHVYSIKPTQEVAINLVNSQLKSAMAKTAVATAKKHVNLYPKDNSLKLMLATMIAGTEPDLALQHYQQIPVELIQQNAISLNNYAYLLAENGEKQKAKPFIQQALAMEPENPAFLNTLKLVESN